jgi:predicted flap endonuclease-1-like 5' DNA nuclease
MPYTLAKGLFWVLAALLLGIVIGWLLRSVAAKRQVARARAHHVDTAELERLRGRVANLEPVVHERDRLKAELEIARVKSLSATPTAIPTAAPIAPEPQYFVSIDQPGPIDAPTSAPISAPSTPDLASAGSVLGKPITLDDLKVVEGIGPKIEGLCHGIGIRTWFDLSTTEVSLLRTMLTDAGSRFRAQDPSTWPQQAAMLAEGRWTDFKTLTDQLSGGKLPE